jgi:hypothetical protein
MATKRKKVSFKARARRAAETRKRRKFNKEFNYGIVSPPPLPFKTVFQVKARKRKKL